MRRREAVQALRVHLENQQQIVFDEGTEEEALESQRETELTAFFELNMKLKQDESQIFILWRIVVRLLLFAQIKTNSSI